MIPIRLTLRNFMSYGEEPTTLPFEGLHVACLSGDNGNGKSALLDAITWVLWDKTRASSAGAASADDLIRLGATDMEVQFEFEAQEGCYRVTRKRRRGKASGDWQLAQRNSLGDFVAVGGGSSRETSKQIVKLLSMEYETFLNSAYLQQGRADEFTRQKPNERKRILSEILGLQRYEILEGKAKQRFSECKARAEEISGEIRILEASVERIEGYQERLQTATESLQELEPKLKQQEGVVAKARERKSEMEGVVRLAEEAQKQLAQAEQEIRQRQQEQATRRTKLQEMETVIAQRDAIESDMRRLQEARTQRDKLLPDVDQYAARKTELEQTRGAIATERATLEGEIRLKESQWAEVERRRKEIQTLQESLIRLETELKGAEQIAQELAETKEALQAVADRFAELKQKKESLDKEVLEIDEVLEILAGPRSACPVCESDLSGTKQERVLAKQQTKRESLLHEVDAVKKEGGATKQRRDTLQKAVSLLEERNQAFVRQCAQREELTRRLKRLQEESMGGESLQKELKILRERLANDAFAEPKRLRLGQLEKDVTRLEGVKAEYDRLQQRIKMLEPTEARLRALQNAEANHKDGLTELERIAQALAELQTRRKEVQGQCEGYRERLAQREGLVRALAVAEEQERTLRSECERQRVEAQSVESYLKNALQAQADWRVRRKEWERISLEGRQYRCLVDAFGRKGIQAMIIENSLPEIEDDANELLGRMTDGAMKVTLATTRDKKSGPGEIATLDIQITDSLGERPYELFSGGEGFRVNFALRLALSRLLARRSGAKLETLIMDEGFGSQDGKGRERLVEVLDAVKDDFKKILVITHFEEMKDAFSQRIEIIKDAGGSRIHVL